MAETTPEERFERLAAALADRPGVTLPGETGGRGFGSDALKVSGSIFAMLTRGRLVVKLPGARVAELIAAGRGLPFDAGKGRPMKEWWPSPTPMTGRGCRWPRRRWRSSRPGQRGADGRDGTGLRARDAETPPAPPSPRRSPGIPPGACEEVSMLASTRDRVAAATGALFVVLVTVGNQIDVSGTDQSAHTIGEIARGPVVSPKTVRNHVSNVVTKLPVTDRSEAVLRARRAGLGGQR